MRGLPAVVVWRSFSIKRSRGARAKKEMKMSLTKGQKRRREQLIAEARAATTKPQAENLWKCDEEKIVAWVRATLLGNPNVWQWVKPLYVCDKSDHEFVTNFGHQWLVKNIALSDKDLAELGIAKREPLEVLRHPNCRDECLKIVAELWETYGADSMDCVAGWATKAQIERMYELRPSCKNKNATLRLL